MTDPTTILTEPVGEDFWTAVLERQFLASALSEAWKAVMFPGTRGPSVERSARIRTALQDIKEGRQETHSGRPLGRPRRLTPKKLKRIAELREKGVPWSKVAQLVGLPMGTCRKVGLFVRGNYQDSNDTIISRQGHEQERSAP